MPRLTRLYTRKGDDGATRLGGGQPVSKASLRVEAYGGVDELSSVIGTALAGGLSEPLVGPLRTIQNELFHLGGDLCYREEDKQSTPLPRIDERHVRALERLIDERLNEVGPLENFLLPGGSPGAAQLHLARAVCRRAERAVARLAAEEPVGPFVIAYLNRLSDALFIFARLENRLRGVPEVLWNSRA